MAQYLFVFLLFFPLSLWAENAHLFAFSRPLKASDSYCFEGSVQVEEKIDVLTSSDTLNTSRSQFFTAHAEGVLNIKKVNSAGHAIDFDVEMLKVDASYAGAKLHHQLNGARVRVVLSNQKPLFSRYDTASLSKNELTILSQMFRSPPKEDLNQLFFGPDTMQKNGTWKTPKEALLTRFNAEKLNVSAEDMNAVASARRIDSDLLLKLEVETKNLKNFEFHMNMSLLLPYDNSLPTRSSLRETRYSRTVNLDKVSTLAPMPPDAKMHRSTYEVIRFDVYKNTLNK